MSPHVCSAFLVGTAHSNTEDLLPLRVKVRVGMHAARTGPESSAVEPAAMRGDGGAQGVIGFYSSKPDRKFREFSNFYGGAPYEFNLPEFACSPGFPNKVACEFSEKAIMLSKAALMKDLGSFKKISECTDPRTTKALGRGVSPWNQELWDEHLEEVAFQVVLQKFAASEALRDVLLSTGDHILAEATKNDCIWGIGIDIDDDRVQDPEQWIGRNVLGHALMRARAHLRGAGRGDRDAAVAVAQHAAHPIKAADDAAMETVVSASP